MNTYRLTVFQDSTGPWGHMTVQVIRPDGTAFTTEFSDAGVTATSGSPAPESIKNFSSREMLIDENTYDDIVQYAADSNSVNHPKYREYDAKSDNCIDYAAGVIALAGGDFKDLVFYDENGNLRNDVMDSLDNDPRLGSIYLPAKYGPETSFLTDPLVTLAREAIDWTKDDDQNLGEAGQTSTDSKQADIEALKDSTGISDAAKGIQLVGRVLGHGLINF